MEKQETPEENPTFGRLTEETRSNSSSISDNETSQSSLSNNEENAHPVVAKQKRYTNLRIFERIQFEFDNDTSQSFNETSDQPRFSYVVTPSKSDTDIKMKNVKSTRLISQVFKPINIPVVQPTAPDEWEVDSLSPTQAAEIKTESKSTQTCNDVVTDKTGINNLLPEEEYASVLENLVTHENISPQLSGNIKSEFNRHKLIKRTVIHEPEELKRNMNDLGNNLQSTKPTKENNMFVLATSKKFLTARQSTENDINETSLIDTSSVTGIPKPSSNKSNDSRNNLIKKNQERDIVSNLRNYSHRSNISEAEASNQIYGLKLNESQKCQCLLKNNIQIEQQMNNGNFQVLMEYLWVFVNFLMSFTNRLFMAYSNSVRED